MQKYLPPTDNFDISWIQRQVECWIFTPNEMGGIVYTKGIVKGISQQISNRGNSKVMCQLENGMQYETKAKDLEKRRSSNRVEKDLILLEMINSAEILKQLKRRFEQKKIHTYIWNSLIIINPFKQIDTLYDEETMKNFYQRVIHQRRYLQEIQPHIYGFVCHILNNMKQSPKIQMINISGQSGSGKTQTNKQCLKMISYVCEHRLKKSDQLQSSSLIQQRILNCDSILECFGNAKTTKNDNSSRFGKLITQRINTDQMDIISCQVKVFFLEKSRIVCQMPDQRNFHIFYLLLANCPQNLKMALGFHNKGQLNANNFAYLQKQFTLLKQGMDKTMWRQLNTAFQLLQIRDEIKKQIFQIIAAVMHLGNIQFDQTSYNDHQPCDIVNQQMLQLIANLLMLEEQNLREALVYHRKVIAKQVLNVPLEKKKCIQGRDSMAKALYENLFLWIVEQLNKKVNQQQKKQRGKVKTIKMLDIYGFEVFKFNSFEQLCVNYTNERIHQIYLEQVFKNEKKQLEKEGLQNIIPQLKFTDNAKVIQLLDTALKSVFNLLDQSCSVNVKDDDFLNNVKKFCDGHQNFPPTNKTNINKSFIIKHTPDDIQYMVNGFRSKNMDFLNMDILERFTKSRSTIISQKFNQLLQMLRNEVNKKFLGFKIRKQVTQLMTQMSSNSDMHFIRCIKPNQQKLPMTFIEKVCYNQIKYLGVLDTVRMRKDCYHVRMSYLEFYRKFGILNGSVKEQIELQAGRYGQSQCKEMVKTLIDTRFRGANLDILYGTTRIFMKMQTNTYLETVLRNKTAKFSMAVTRIKVLYRHRYKVNQRRNYAVWIRKVQKTMRSFLKDIINIKRKNAVNLISGQWQKRRDEYMRRKRRVLVMSVQSYIKCVVEMRIFQKKEQYAVMMKNMLRSAMKTMKVYGQYEKYILIKKLVISNLYDTIWNKFKVHYQYKIRKYTKTFHILIYNRDPINRATKHQKQRRQKKSINTLKRCLKAIPYFTKFMKYRSYIVKIQKYLKMGNTRLRYLSLKAKTVVIQRKWRRYRQLKISNIENLKLVYGGIEERENEWKERLFRNFRDSQIGGCVADGIGMEKILQKFQRIKKNKMILFYYLLDIQILCEDPSLENWLEHYLALASDSLQKLNPIQFVDISDTHSTATTTNKIYLWGSVRGEDTGIREYQVGQGKLSKISVWENVTRIDSVNPSIQQIITLKDIEHKAVTEDQDNTTKQWSTLFHNFVLINGIILTMQHISFSKINTPQKVNQLSCGMGHIICKTILKKVYTWGRNDSGQLGTGDTTQTNSTTPRLVEYFVKKKVLVCQVAASIDSSIVIDNNCKMYWFGSNGTINNVCIPEQVILSNKSQFICNSSKYSPIRIISKWSKTMSIIGITMVCHDGILKNQISFRKKILQSLMTKWNQDINTTNPPYSQSVADHISQRHMPLPMIYSGMNSNTRGPSNKQISEKIRYDLQKFQEVQRQLLKLKNKKGNNVGNM